MCGNPDSGAHSERMEGIRKLTAGGAAGSGRSDSCREIPFS